MRRLNGAELVRHLELSGSPLTLRNLAVALPKVPGGSRAGLISHFLDRVRRHPDCAGEGHDDESTRIILDALQDIQSNATDHRDETQQGLQRDLLQLLDVALRRTQDAHLVRAGLQQLATHVAWISPQTLTRRAADTDIVSQQTLAKIVGRNENVYHTFNESGPQTQALHQMVHDQHREHLADRSPARTELERSHPPSGSTLWHRRALQRPWATHRGTGAAARRWDELVVAAFAEQYLAAEDDPRWLQQWHTLLMTATAGADVDIAALLRPERTKNSGGAGVGGTVATWAVVGADLEALLTYDQVDVDLAAPVWAVVAAARGTSQHVPLAQMNHTSRLLVWETMWRRWLTEGGTGRWPTWCPWPSSDVLEHAPALLLHADLPHADPAGWVRERLAWRISQQHAAHQHEGRAAAVSDEEDGDVLDDAYCQALTLSSSWAGTLGSLLDACSASLLPPPGTSHPDAP